MHDVGLRPVERRKLLVSILAGGVDVDGAFDVASRKLGGSANVEHDDVVAGRDQFDSLRV